ncbi:MAG: ATP-binding protein, partial [Lachnoclostridium sp.]|nr:ATP-binding protein [Lachnoclostridium sp.]
MNESLSFRVSTGLKNIIGRDLISDKYIAIFELVKNSYDAGASNVKIEFTSDKYGNEIIISDNGSGMSYNDIVQKWLFVAYSEKKQQNRVNSTYRDQIRREVAGAKGVGRFSCDRLGATLQLRTKTENDVAAHIINVNWNNFEFDDSREFMEVPVEYSTTTEFSTAFDHGTILIIKDLRELWDREELLRLKRSLMKLISPDANLGETPFFIDIAAKHEIEGDLAAPNKKDFNPDRDVVNGPVHNDIFEKLNIKTTSIEVSISENGDVITSKLTDRGQYIFTIAEKNREYRLLNDIHISVFYLNRSAKVSFTRQMGGVQPVNYGSIFIYKNGFRINPYGEPGQDFFNINQRKAQGYNRFLGTRELMGRISIGGENNQFIETSSRAHGFISTPAVEMLTALFYEKVLKVLERYVVNIISWGEPIKTEYGHIIEPAEVIDKIIAQFIVGANSSDIISVDYNEDLLNSFQVPSQPDNIQTSLKKLETVAEKTQDLGLKNLAHAVKQRTEAIISYNIDLENENATKEKELTKAYQQSIAREKQIYFLQSVKNQNEQNLINGYHTVYALTDAIKGNIDYLKDLVLNSEINDKHIMLEILGDIMQSNEKAHKLADLAIHGNQSLKQ